MCIPDQQLLSNFHFHSPSRDLDAAWCVRSAVRRSSWLALAVLLAVSPTALAADRATDDLGALHDRIATDLRAGAALRVQIYVALCDNDSQGIVPVKNRRICDGEAPEQNLYWRTGGGIASYLQAQRYRTLEYSELSAGPIAIRARFAKELPAGASLRAQGIARVPVEVTALAYRGAHIASAMFDFVRAVHAEPATGRDAPHVVGYIGHDYFLDGYDPRELARAREGSSQLQQGVFALSCLGNRYIRPEITRPNAHILVLNRGLTYPGAWTVGGLLSGLARGDSLPAIHRLAAQRFADGQKKPYGAILRSFASGS
jgi:hypothetical protein